MTDPRTLLETVVADDAGRVIVETRLVACATWETVVMPGDDPAPDGEHALVVATVHRAHQARVEHEAAVAFATAALQGTRRRPGSASRP